MIVKNLDERIKKDFEGEKNVGEEIKKIAIANFIVELLFSVFSSIGYLASHEYDEAYFTAFLILCGGIFIAFIMSLFIYGFGALISDVRMIREKLCDEPVIQEEAEEITSVEKQVNLKKAAQCECGELYYVRFCPVCGKSAMKNPEYFPTYEEAEARSEKIDAELKDRKCGICW